MQAASATIFTAAGGLLMAFISPTALFESPNSAGSPRETFTGEDSGCGGPSPQL